MPTFTIVTVCRNAEEVIEDTIKSVYTQSDSDYEYIIIDGASTDRTLRLIRKYRYRFKKKRVDYRIVSEPDTGIFNAMNKATKMATGEWIIFMNAGDQFSEKNVIKNIHDFCNKNHYYDVIFGDTIVITYDMTTYFPSKINKEEGVFDWVHQSVITKTYLIKERPYDETIKYCADYDFYIDMYNRKKNFGFFHIPFAIYQTGGFSDCYESILESKKVRTKYGFLLKEDIIQNSEFESAVDENNRGNTKRKNNLPPFVLNRIHKLYRKWSILIASETKASCSWSQAKAKMMTCILQGSVKGAKNK